MANNHEVTARLLDGLFPPAQPGLRARGRYAAASLARGDRAGEDLGSLLGAMLAPLCQIVSACRPSGQKEWRRPLLVANACVSKAAARVFLFGLKTLHAER